MLGRIYMPHPGHFIGGQSCCFHLNTYVNGYIVSTVGEYAPSHVFENGAMRPRRDDDPVEPFGYPRESSLYETMVFRAKKSEETDAKWQCCPWRQADGHDLDFKRYATATDAVAGHEAMLKKYEETPCA